VLALVKEERSLARSISRPPRLPHLHAVPDRASHAAGVQAAISLENAHLYAQIQSENILLREQLHKRWRGLMILPPTKSFGGQSTPFRTPSPSWSDGSTLGANAFVLGYTGLSLEEVTDEDSRGRVSIR